VLEFEYAAQIARDWNSKESRSGNIGYVTRFFITTAYLNVREIHEVGGRQRREYWIRADELPAFNAELVSPIEVVATFENGVQVARGPRPIAMPRGGPPV
jgi:hypothetical protein